MPWEQGVGWAALLAMVIVLASGGGGVWNDLPMLSLFAAVALSL